ncbi:RNA pol II carboxy terminal domain phosphatase [Cryptosporidium ubiquitum]|uniref:protein-serine/threonine phosphatase n=1 Tax=Cryptosporidium ubiquitum TaxID=857276 RepID=A0A1J4MJ04_9CRYT|nr:RNA pol II carboxy terminal domain phosphatase [Cryptosporidium ubiquitum]OII72837.1 RNA pol II carboxy terminal domain phosphatase [Cryptosporidium ubiquitum]
MGEDERINIKCLTEIFKCPVKLEWRKYLNDRVKPGEIILSVSDLKNGQEITVIKSICHGKIASCLTPKSCEIISVKEQSTGNDNISELEIIEIKDSEEDCNEKSVLHIKQENPNCHNNRYYFGYYLCDHTTFLSNICVECGFILQTKNQFCTSNKLMNRDGAGNSNDETAEIHSNSRDRHDYKTGNHYNKDGNERMLINAGFLSNSNDIKFNKHYVDKQEKSFIFELLYIKRKLNLVLDLDNTLIHASSNLPENKKKEEFISIKEIMENEITEEIYNKYCGSVVMLESKSLNTELLPKGIDVIPHYIDETDPKIQIYFKLLESLVFCIPFGNYINSGTEKPRISSSWSFGYYKLRPGVINMLKTLSKEKYEIYMYTMGTEYHAYTSLRILDPELRFFHSKRIFYRNNGFKDTSIKSLNTLFPYDHRTLVILDDIEQAWSDINSLLKAYPYNFFPSNSIPNDSGSFSRYISQIRTNNKWSQLIKKKRTRSDQEAENDIKEKNEVDSHKIDKDMAKDQSSIDIIKEIIKSEKDLQLLIFQKLLIAIHDAYFKEFDAALSKKSEFQDEDSLIQMVYKEAPNISNIIKIMRKEVLKNCTLQFTGFNNKFFYNFVDSDLYKWCRYFGSSLLDNNTKNSSEKLLATHCICEQLYTEKYHHAKEKGIPCINILWLESIIYTWISPCNININNPLLNDPVNSDYYSPFETLNFTNKESSDYIDFENYSYSYLYSTNTSESLKEQLWEEAFNDISFSMGEDDDDENISGTDSNSSLDYLHNRSPHSSSDERTNSEFVEISESEITENSD